MLGYTTSNSFQVRMPIDDLNSSSIYLIVRIRDQYDCMTELNLSSISITSDMNNMISLMTIIQSAVVNSDFRNIINTNPILNILYSGNQNDVCQILTSFTQILNLLSEQNLQMTINSKSFLLHKMIYFFFFLKMIYPL